VGLFRFGEDFFFSQIPLGPESIGLDHGFVTFERPGALQ
jgi:hypothetical protein